MELRVPVVGEEAVAHLRAGVLDLGIETVLVHVDDPRGGVVGAGPHVLPPDVGRVLLRWKAAALRQPEQDRVGDPLENPGVCVIQADHVRRPLREFFRYPAGPDVGRLNHMRVG